MSDRSKASKPPVSDLQRFKNLCKALSEDALRSEYRPPPKTQPEPTYKVEAKERPKMDSPKNFDEMKKAVNLGKSLPTKDSPPARQPTSIKPKKE